MKELQLFAGIVCAIYAVLLGDFLWRALRIGKIPLSLHDGLAASLVGRLVVVLGIAVTSTLATLLIRTGLS